MRLLATIRDNLHAVQADLGQADVKRNLDEAKRWVEAVRRGRIFFYSEREVEIGLRDIDWSGAHIAHQEWPAQLNRFFFLPHLVAVYQETGEPDLPQLARRIIEDWIDQHDYSAEAPLAPGDNTLNLSIRLGQSRHCGWWRTVPEFCDSPAFDEAFVQRMIASSKGQLDCLYSHLTGGGNWRVSQLDCMLLCALVVPGLDAYREFAIRNLNEAFHRQVDPDGAHEEHNPSYHNWMRHVFTDLWRLAAKRPELGLRIDPRRVVRMWDYSVCATAPDGGDIGLHDQPAWKTGPGRIELLAQRRELIAETGLQDVAADLDALPSRYFPDAGQIFMRDQWSEDATLIVFDASRWGGGHSHLSKNSLSLYSGSRMLLCDPGVFTYEMSDPFGVYGKSTPAHNTVNLAGMSQAESDPHVRRVNLFPDIALVQSAYEGGYWPGHYTWRWCEGKHPGLFGMHSRTLLWLAGRGAIVWDHLTVDREGQPYAVHWQFPAGPCEIDAKALTARTLGETDNLLLHVPSASDPLRLRLYQGCGTPLRGWLPKGQPGDYQPAPMIAFEACTQSCFTDLTTLLLPFRGKEAPKLRCETFTDTTKRALGCTIKWADGDEEIVVTTPRLACQVGESESIDSDGTLVAISLRNHEPWRILLVDGMFVRFRGETMLDKPVAGTYLWRHDA